MSVIFPSAGQSGYNLSQYLFLLRRLLHDATAKMYTDADLTQYINLARQNISADTCCVRQLQTGVTFTQGIDTYNIYTYLPMGSVTVDVLGIAVYYGNLRVKMRYMDYTTMDANNRAILSYQQCPVIFSKYANNIVVAPVPNQTYTSDWDTAIVPDVMTDNTTPEQIPIPFQECVPFYAAYYAKQYEQSFGEADRFMQQYIFQKQKALRQSQRRVIRNPYQPE